jgi:hypothetical protein
MRPMGWPANQRLFVHVRGRCYVAVTSSGSALFNADARRWWAAFATLRFCGKSRFQDLAQHVRHRETFSRALRLDARVQTDRDVDGESLRGLLGHRLHLRVALDTIADRVLLSAPAKPLLAGHPPVDCGGRIIDRVLAEIVCKDIADAVQYRVNAVC